MITAFHALVGVWLFILGAVVGSFLNVCIYRIPWQKSVIWPASHCPRCLLAIAAYDNIPIVSWLALRGECRHCGTRISPRYLFIELLVGLIFLAIYLSDVVFGQGGFRTSDPYYRMAYHQLFAVLLVVATFIDYDLQIIPDQVTVPGMIVGLLGGGLMPMIRPEPGMAETFGGGLWVGIVGLAVGAGLTQFFRLGFSKLLRREAMGFGDVTLMAMIGAFLGWQPAVLAFFFAPFFGIVHALWKVIVLIQKRLRGVQGTAADREMPFGPYLSLAALTLLISWPWLWVVWGRDFFRTMHEVVSFLIFGL